MELLIHFSMLHSAGMPHESAVGSPLPFVAMPPPTQLTPLCRTLYHALCRHGNADTNYSLSV